MLLKTKNHELESLRQELQSINSKLQLSLDIEMLKLKDQERELQEALKFKTRTDLIKAMENELALESLEESTQNFKSLPNYNLSYNSNLTNSNQFLKSLKIEEDLNKSYQILDNLIKEKDNQHKTEMIQSYTSNNFKSLPIPNVIFSKSSRYSRTPQKNVKSVTIYRKPAEQNLNQQQTLVLGDSWRYSKSTSDLNRSSYSSDNEHLSSSYNPYARPIYDPSEYAKSIRDNYFYSKKETINGIPKSKIRKTNYWNNADNGYAVLPVSKTVIHKKPWSYGKVETNYYPFRDSMLNKK